MMFFSSTLMGYHFVRKKENWPLEGGNHTHCPALGPNHLVEMPTTQISCYSSYSFLISLPEHRSESLWPNQLQVHHRFPWRCRQRWSIPCCTENSNHSIICSTAHAENLGFVAQACGTPDHPRFSSGQNPCSFSASSPARSHCDHVHRLGSNATCWVQNSPRSSKMGTAPRGGKDWDACDEFLLSAWYFPPIRNAALWFRCTKLGHNKNGTNRAMENGDRNRRERLEIVSGFLLWAKLHQITITTESSKILRQQVSAYFCIAKEPKEKPLCIS